MIKKFVLIFILIIGFVATNALLAFAIAPSNGSWVPTGDMTVGRTSFAITLLQNGQALVAEGVRADYNGPLIPYAELYDQATGTWSQTGSLVMPRISAGENLITLQNGKVLLAGGSDATTSAAYTEAELYDPTTGTWLTTGSMNTPRRFAAYVLLNDGRVLAAAGNPNQGPGTPTNTAEIYDPSTGTWSSTGSLVVARDNPSMIKLRDGRVLIAGGEIPGNTCDNSPEIFDPTTGTWSSAGTMPNRWEGDSQLTLLADGRVFAAGGYCNPFGSNVSGAAIYDPATNRWTAAPPVPVVPAGIMFLLDNGQVMVRSGSPDGKSPPVMELYDPSTNTWTQGASLPFGNSIRGVALANGDELAAGDIVGDPSNPANVLPHATIYTASTSLPAPTNLTIPSPTQNPVLSWTTSSGAASYNIYRNGSKIGSSMTASYADNTAPEGTDSYYVTAVNGSSESGPSNNVNVLVDRTAPTLGTPSWSANPLKVNTGNATLSVSASDNGSGVASGEYFIGTDPGVGKATAMTYSSGNLTASIGSGMVAGVYIIGVRAKDAADNWSSTTATMLVIYDSSTSLGMIGKDKKGELVPSLANGDIMPGLTSTSTAGADYGFSVQYKKGALDPHNGFSFTYSNGGHTFSLTATSFDWMTTGGTNNSQGWFQGTAQVTVDGVTTTNPFWVTGTDGSRLTPSTSNYLLLRIYAPGADPSTATPIYQASGTMTSKNSVRIQ